MQIELVSPETITYSGEADYVLARTRGGGDIAFQPGHVPFVGSLEICKVEILTTDGGREAFAVHGGFLQVAGDKVTILSDVSEHQKDIDVRRAQAARDRARGALDEDEGDAAAAAALARSLLRLRTAGADETPV
ncbi:MAG: ATP synthase F1 subunit epsilon [Acidimicrobiales bacterium]